MTIREALVNGTDLLNHAGIETPGVDAGVMLCHVIGCDKAFLYSHGDDTIDKQKLDEYLNCLYKRNGGMPVQYITGVQEFMGLSFHVEPGVLIPRHDTETLVDAAIDFGKAAEHGLKILEIGVGSGCIAVSLAYHIKNSFIYACDISQKALDIARMNAIKNGVNKRIELIQSDIFENINKNDFDLIISNPPYIMKKDIITLQREVKDFEPTLALDGGADGLYFYRKMIKDTPGFLKEGGALMFEVGINQALDVAGLMRRNFSCIATVKDLAGIDRVVTGRLYTKFMFES